MQFADQGLSSVVRGRGLYSFSKWKEDEGKTWSQLPVGVCGVCRRSTLGLGHVLSPHHFTFAKNLPVYGLALLCFKIFYVMLKSALTRNAL